MGHLIPPPLAPPWLAALRRMPQAGADCTSWGCLGACRTTCAFQIHQIPLGYLVRKQLCEGGTAIKAACCRIWGQAQKDPLQRAPKKGARVPSWSTAKRAAQERQPAETTSQEMYKTIFSEGTICRGKKRDSLLMAQQNSEQTTTAATCGCKGQLHRLKVA